MKDAYIRTKQSTVLTSIDERMNTIGNIHHINLSVLSTIERDVIIIGRSRMFRGWLLVSVGVIQDSLNAVVINFCMIDSVVSSNGVLGCSSTSGSPDAVSSRTEKTVLTLYKIRECDLESRFLGPTSLVRTSSGILSQYSLGIKLRWFVSKMLILLVWIDGRGLVTFAMNVLTVSCQRCLFY
jgi:hypothetical protein